ncbi:MAG: thioredoxin domain-containing protein [Ignavibacteriae bacterium]|nr:thioredoxin domain-containing protein [Ignavibacteriota bacterium]
MNTNNLINEKSPYLLQHAGNPVNWYAWNDKSLELAKKQNKPIFLSVGYSTCYWCHVMERESFENENIASLLNKYFINIKVDREERPDIDRVYMTALQSMTGSGGWPMNMFLTPDLKPFYGATYIPPKAKYGRSGFEDVIEQINNLWITKKDDLINSGEKIFSILNSRLKIKSNSEINIDESVFEKSFETIKNIFDYDNGGFGIGNKFPRPVVLNYLLSLYHKEKNPESLDMVIFTLKKMCDGGLYDHIGGGFHRYSVDLYWRVPHFEKMLYDQAQIVNTLLDTYSITGKKYFLDYAEDTLDYVLNNLTDKSGGFYSAEDAESAIEDSIPGYKEEGFYYLWEKNQIDEILGNEYSQIFSYMFGIKHEGNTISDPHDVFKNRNVLYISSDAYETAKKFNQTPEEIELIVSECKNILRNKRDKRPRPHLDDKILTSWNSLMISAFARAYNITNDSRYLEAAVKSIDFIIGKMWDSNSKTLYHRYRDSEVKFKSGLEGYAFFIKALIDMYETTFDDYYLAISLTIADSALYKFYDKENYGFFDSETDSSDIIIQTKEIYDGAEPSGNAVIVEDLLRLYYFSGNKSYLEAAEKSIKYFFPELQNLPFSSPYMLNNLFFLLGSPKEIIFTGDFQDENLLSMVKYIHGKYVPFKILLHADEKTEEISAFIKDIITDYKPAKFYVCENKSCKLPVDNPDELKKII